MPGRFIPAGAGNTAFAGVVTSASSVHPRWRVEHLIKLKANGKVIGSSPLARGTRRARSRVQGQFRFIPAGAGNTTADRMRKNPPAVHPRWRGEHSAASSSAARKSGSSPLARGTQIEWERVGSQWRFIPAGAGNTQDAAKLDIHVTVHPRWRGEHRAQCCLAVAHAGSSPLARGTRPRLGGFPPGRRFIPAGAGNTRAHPPACLAVPVHPRWRGEHHLADHLAVEVHGSSPLARGTQDQQPGIHAAHRFIPAGAGNTTGGVARADDPAVHPRWRGEHSVWTWRVVAGGGSSPLARGTPANLIAAAPDLRFIPAGAGNTHCACCARTAWRGSSPLARGTPSRIRWSPGRGRFIPAGAGNTRR